MEQPPQTPPANYTELSTSKPKRSKNIYFAVIGIIILLLVVGVVAYMLGTKSQQKNTTISQVPITDTPTPTQREEKVTPTKDVNPTSIWQTHKIEKLGIEFKLPEEFGDMIMEERPGTKGSKLSISFSKNDNITMGVTSVDFEEGRGGVFTDLQGYEVINGVYHAKFVSGKTFEVPSVLVTEIKNPTMTLLKIKGQNFGNGLPLAGTLGEGRWGALLNTKNTQYTGLAIDTSFGSEASPEPLIDQILSTFKTTE